MADVFLETLITTESKLIGEAVQISSLNAMNWYAWRAHPEEKSSAYLLMLWDVNGMAVNKSSLPTLNFLKNGSAEQRKSINIIIL